MIRLDNDKHWLWIASVVSCQLTLSVVRSDFQLHSPLTLTHHHQQQLLQCNNESDVHLTINYYVFRWQQNIDDRRLWGEKISGNGRKWNSPLRFSLSAGFIWIGWCICEWEELRLLLKQCWIRQIFKHIDDFKFLLLRGFKIQWVFIFYWAVKKRLIELSKTVSRFWISNWTFSFSVYSSLWASRWQRFRLASEKFQGNFIFWSNEEIDDFIFVFCFVSVHAQRDENIFILWKMCLISFERQRLFSSVYTYFMCKKKEEIVSMRTILLLDWFFVIAYTYFLKSQQFRRFSMCRCENECVSLLRKTSKSEFSHSRLSYCEEARKRRRSESILNVQCETNKWHRTVQRRDR